MGQITFQSNQGGQVNLIGPSTASTYNINVPATTGNMVTTGDSATVTTGMLASTTGSGAVVLATSPTLVTPALGTPSALVGTNITGTASGLSIGGNAATATSATTATTATNVSGGTASVTTLAASSTTTLSGGTANGVAYLNGSKVVTTGSALVFDGTNLGVGVTPSAWSSAKAVESQYGAFATGSAGGGVIWLSQNAYYGASSWTYKTTAAAGMYQILGNAHSWHIAASGTAGNAITFTQAMTLDSSGNLTVPAMYGTTVTTPRNVFIDSTGKMGGISSIRASKINIENLLDANWLTALTPVTFNYRKRDVEGNYTDEFENELQYGLIAEDVEAIKPEFCIYVDGKLAGIHYDRMISPLIKIIQNFETRLAALEAK